MADESPKFQDKKLYRCQVKRSGFVRMGTDRKPIFSVELEVTGGEMAGEILPKRFFFTAETKSRSQDELRLLGLNPAAEGVEKWPALILGKECAAECQIGWDSKNNKFFPPAANSIRPLSELTPGSIEAEIAEAIGNSVTKVPDPDAFNDRY